MPSQKFPEDRFDAVPRKGARVGAHRAPHPGVRPLAVVLWALVIAVILFIAGFIGITMLMHNAGAGSDPSATGRNASSASLALEG